MKQLVGSRFQVSGGVYEFTVATDVFPVTRALSPSAPLGAPETLLPTAALQRSCAEKHWGSCPKDASPRAVTKRAGPGKGVRRKICTGDITCNLSEVNDEEYTRCHENAHKRCSCMKNYNKRF